MSKCEISAFKYLYTYKKRIWVFGKSSTAVAGSGTRMAQTKFWCIDQYIITTLMKRKGSMGEFMLYAF